MLMVAAGCQRRIEDIYEPSEHQGAVDESLTPKQQAQQVALRRCLNSIMGGIALDFLPDHHDDLAFEETEETFLEGHALFAGWDWNGPPDGDDFPVMLRMKDDDLTDTPVFEVPRVYNVKKTSGYKQYRITRKQE